MQSDRVQVAHDREELTLHLDLCDRVLPPVLRILLILEHVDTRMCDIWESFMEFSDPCKCLSWLDKRKPEDEVDIQGDLIFFVILRRRICLLEQIPRAS